MQRRGAKRHNSSEEERRGTPVATRRQQRLGKGEEGELVLGKGTGISFAASVQMRKWATTVTWGTDDAVTRQRGTTAVTRKRNERRRSLTINFEYAKLVFEKEWTLVLGKLR
ncbi:hypothetical protein PIB30_005648 [Stylosanthes scabra]|uniref:Uncharacterized protein n=1 Tax=Stylosanthes scabra TaxID=79078 RepID=A0ABU6T3T9_9FABA|nr:hypothetical protein [Stylosanthes scabra]